MIKVVFFVSPSLHNLHTVYHVCNSVKIDYMIYVCNRNHTQKLFLDYKKYLSIGHILFRLFYYLLNYSSDNYFYNKYFKREKVNSFFKKNSKFVRFVENFNSTDLLNDVDKFSPDIALVHTQEWIGKKLRRSIPNSLVFGGHPGMTQFYRGSHSSFWSVFNGDSDMIAATTFWVGGGVDDGDIVFQQKIIPAEKNSIYILSWKGMLIQSEMFVNIIKFFLNKKNIPKQPISVTSNSIYGQPNILHYIKFLFIQRKIK